jgi:hypothetical protein
MTAFMISIGIAVVVTFLALAIGKNMVSGLVGIAVGCILVADTAGFIGLNILAMFGI